MNDETEHYLKVEQHDKRVWFGVSPSTIWRVLACLGFLWVGGGKDVFNKPEFATKADIERVEHELKAIDSKVSFLSGRMGLYGQNGQGGQNAD